MLDFTFEKISCPACSLKFIFIPMMYLYQCINDKIANTVKHPTLTSAGYTYFCSEFSCSHSKSLNQFIKDK